MTQQLSEFNKLYLDMFARTEGIVAGNLLFSQRIDPKDAGGHNNVIAYISVKPQHIEVFIKQLVYDQELERQVWIRHTMFAIAYDQAITYAIQENLNNIFGVNEE